MPERFTTKLGLALALAIGALATSLPAAAQTASDFPNRRITMIVPYPAGGIVDIATRLVTEKLSARLGQPIIIENKAGGNTNIGHGLAARAEPDGYTWTFMGPATLANPHISPGLTWSTDSFVGVGITAWAPFAVVVNPDSPANTVQEFVELAKKSPGTFNYANTGIGSAMHMNTVVFMQETKTDLTMIPYQGQPQAIIDLLANRVHFIIASTGLVSQHVQEKKLKALAVIAHQPSPLLPGVRTMAELGLPSVNVVPWYGFGVPKNTPQAVVDKINAEINAVLRDPDLKAVYSRQSLDVVKPMSPKEIADLIAKDSAELGKVVKAANIKLAP